MPLQSLNPTTEEVVQTFEELSDAQIEAKLAQAQERFESWHKTSFAERSNLMKKLAETLREQKNDLAKLMTLEMGKVVKQAVGEIEKCAWCCEFYADHAEEFLQNEVVNTDASESYVAFEPIGIVLAVMPWNFPFWQVIRFIAPAAMAGNVGILKHASNVPQCAEALERVFLDAGFPKGVFQNLLIGSKKVATIIADDRIKAVTLTGSEQAGSAVAAAAGKALKKSVLELGGTNPFIILEDADMELVVQQSVFGRFQNCGQSCIAAKRFLVVAERADEFIEQFTIATEKLTVGDPLAEGTDMGPLSSENGLKDIERQVNESVSKGATIITGGKRLDRPGFFYEPTLVTNLTPGMPMYDEETFGPAASIIRVKDADEAIAVANSSPYGLGASIFTQDIERAKKMIPELYTSTVFINGFVKSDPRLPFGGVGLSGYGRELSHYGIKEFMNIKTVWVKY